ncbi:MAG: hypothetical protein WC627_07895 [Legionella sp.]|jgi:hypothetical protein
MALRGLGAFTFGYGLIFGLPGVALIGLIIWLATPTPYVVTAGVTTAAVGTGAAVFSVATLGIGAGILYGLGALAALYVGAKNGANPDTTAGTILKESIIRPEGLTLTSPFKALASIIWFPFLAIGVGIGKLSLAISESRLQASGNPFADDHGMEVIKSADISSNARNNSKEIDPTVNSYHSLHQKPKAAVVEKVGSENTLSL